MLAARLSKALPRVAQAVRGRAMSGPTISEQLGSVKDVKVKDIPQWASSVQKDPKTEAAVKGFFNSYQQEYIKTGSAGPIWHVIGIMFTLGYANDYYCHLRHEGNYKYH